MLGQLSTVPMARRERQILELAIDGLTDKQIAMHLGISGPTVKTYWARIRERTGACNRAQAIAKTLVQSYESVNQPVHEAERLAHSSTLGVHLGSADGDIHEANDTFLRMVQYEREELCGLNWSALTPDEYRIEDALALRQMLECGCCEPYAKEYYRKDSTRVALIAGRSLVENQPGRVLSYYLEIPRIRNLALFSA